MKSLGTHLLADLWNCAELDPENYERIIRNAVEQSGATLISFQQHEFQPQGYTGIALLAESHLSIHTWPEKQFVAIDYFTCGDREPCETALEILVDHLHPANVETVIVQRGKEPLDNHTQNSATRVEPTISSRPLNVAQMD